MPSPGDQPAVEIFGLGGERVRGAALPVGASAVDGDSAGGALDGGCARGERAPNFFEKWPLDILDPLSPKGGEGGRKV